MQVRNERGGRRRPSRLLTGRDRLADKGMTVPLTSSRPHPNALARLSTSETQASPA